MPKDRKKFKKAVREVKNKLWIYTEGKKTEQIYIKGFIKDKYPNNKRIEYVCVEDVKQNTAESLIKRIKSDQNTDDHSNGDIYWVAYDRESEQRYSAAIHQRARNSAEGANIKVALSNVCIEQYLLFHFTTSQASYSCCDDLLKKSKLKAFMKTVGINNYDKADENLYTCLKSKVSDAIQNAKLVNKASLQAAQNGTALHQISPYSDFYLILEAIDDFVTKK